MRRFIKDNRGMTLIELLIAITILGLVAAPLLHGFLTSAQTEVKARKMGEVTSVAQNVMETVEGNGYEAITNANADTLESMFGVADGLVQITTDDYGKSVVGVKDLLAGNKSYNAQVEINPQGYNSINSFGLSVNTGMDIVFEVPNNETTPLKERTIVMTVKRDGNSITFDVKYHFGNEEEMKPVDSKTYTVEDSEVPSVYLMYAPSYTKDGDYNTDIIEIYNEGTETTIDEVEFDLYLIKQKHAGFQKEILKNMEDDSVVHVKQYLKRSYILYDKDIGAMIYSNVTENLGDGTKLNSTKVTYTVYNDRSPEPTTTDDLKTIQIETKPSTRIYQVTVKVFDSDKGFSGEPLSTLKGAILK